MWLRVGSYPEKEMAMEIASKLRNAGARVEIKELVEWNVEEKYVIRGKFSELEEYEEIQEWKEYAKIIRNLLKKKLDVEVFESEFLNQAAPEDFKLVKRISGENISDDEFLDAMEAAMKLSFLMASVYGFLKVNGIEIDEVVEGELPDDPQIVIELEEEVDGCEKIYYYEFTPTWDVSVDILSVIRNEVEIEEIEGDIIDAASRVLMNIIAGLSETNDIEELREYSSGIASESDSEKIFIDAEDVFDIMMKSLEKAGIIRISGRKVKLKK